jgi:alkylation response protein AidB-like acyl-CoA dehydrogenase
MSTPSHPSVVIAPELVQAIRDLSAEAEKTGRLHEEQLAIIYAQRWFNLFVPAAYGGLALSLPEALRIEEALAWTDGSAGWTVTLCSGANWFVGFLEPSAAQEVYNNSKVCLAGSGKASGIAKVTADGYEITGEWNYATGAPHATVFTANCVIEKDGITLQDPLGGPLVQSFWFHREEVTIRENWQSMGMIATASHGFAVNRLTVPANRSFVLQPGRAVLTDPVYHFPFLQFAEATLAVNYSGMAIRFLDLCHDLFAEKINHPNGNTTLPPLTAMLQEATATLQQARTPFYTAITRSWDMMLSHQTVADILLQEMSHTSRRLATIARQQVDALYPFCGLTAANPSTTINRVWRDLHTASQHTLLVYPQE